jgi:hypothetical protein
LSTGMFDILYEVLRVKTRNKEQGKSMVHPLICAYIMLKNLCLCENLLCNWLVNPHHGICSHAMCTCMLVLFIECQLNNMLGKSMVHPLLTHT